MTIFRWSSLKDLCALEHLTIIHVNLTGLPDQRTYEGHPKSLIDHFPASLKTLKITDIGFHYITALLLDVVGLLKERTSMPSLVSVSLEAFTREDSRLTFCDNIIFWFRSHNDPRIKGQVRLDIGQNSGLLIQHDALKPYSESYTFRFFKGADHLDAASFARLASSVNDEVSVTINIQPAPSYIEEKK
ncbi:uncharacterized protein AKAW2_11091A [Aspergillus luchuensis]|uniref:Uncharacterized protein n=1 Tax=Aspergillus kawachii TaxID=1069201 RepID=A0A7R7W0E8_ASPKA|nr:uncharacterized protein AKAW2_11091A [Aspergillus luchuensis]BCR94045.1 hypothetical protein AKAW2_11091A [Aspergillus luchuensis]